MNQNDVLFDLSIAYTKDSEDMSQAQYLRDKLGVCTGGMQVEFSKFLRAATPEWQEMAEKFRETGKSPLFTSKSYKEAVFKKAVALWDLQNETDGEGEEQQHEKVVKALGTKRKSSSRTKTTRAPRNTRSNKTNTKVIEEHLSPPLPNAKRRKTRQSPGKKKSKNTDATDSPNFEAMEGSLALLKGGINQIQLHYNSMKYALVGAREASKDLGKEKSDLEVELEHVSESLEEESATVGQLKAENKKLRGESAKRTDALARKSAANKKLKEENDALRIALETTKEEHIEKLTKQTERLDDERKTNLKLQEQIVTLRSELEQIGKLHCRATESFSVQTKLLQEQCKILVSPEAASSEQKSPTVDGAIHNNLSDKTSHKARRISL